MDSKTVNFNGFIVRENIFMSKANLMLEILNSPEMEYIIDEDNQLYYLQNNSKNKYPIAVETEEFKEFCSSNYYEKHNDTITEGAFRQAITALKGIKKKEIEVKVLLKNRVAYDNNIVWHQLSPGIFVRVSKDNVSVVNECPVFFRLYGHQESLPKPVLDNKNPMEILNVLFEYANITDKDQQLLFIVNIIFSLIPDVSHPIDLFVGPPGSAKTSTSQIKKYLVDPVSGLRGFSLPRNETDYQLMASQHHVITFDNVPLIKNWQSDMLCKGVTGDAVSKRKLYTDNDQILYRVNCCQVINGLHVPTVKSDFLDRCLLFNLDRINAKKRREESSIVLDFNKNKPKILGAMYKVLSKAMKIYEEIHIEELPRMADFGKWGCAIATALGYSKDDFTRAYYNNRKLMRQELSSSNSLIEVVISYVNSKEEKFIREKPSELLANLNSYASRNNIEMSGIPSTPVWLTRKFNELAHIFEEEGIIITTSKTGDREIIIEKLLSYCPDSVSEVGAKSECTYLVAEKRGSFSENLQEKTIQH